MTQLQILTNFTQLFDTIKQSLTTFSDNFHNETLPTEPSEDIATKITKGETLFTEYEEDEKNISQLLEKENEIVEFFTKCKENKEMLISRKNKLISELISLKKEVCENHEEFVNYRKEWNEKRIETPDQKNRRECEEMMEEMNEKEKRIEEMKMKVENEKKVLEEMIEKAEKEKNELNIKEKFTEVVPFHFPSA